MFFTSELLFTLIPEGKKIRKKTYHMSQDASVLWTIPADINKSGKSPSLSIFSSLGKCIASSGMHLPFTLATLLSMSLASVTRPFLRSQRMDSGVKLRDMEWVKKTDNYKIAAIY